MIVRDRIAVYIKLIFFMTAISFFTNTTIVVGRASAESIKNKPGDYEGLDEESDYGGLWRTGVNESNVKLTANRDDPHWTYNGFYNSSGADPCQSSVGVGQPAKTVYEKGSSPYGTGGERNAGIGANWPNSSDLNGLFSWQLINSNASWISRNAEGLHDSYYNTPDDNCPDPSGPPDPTNAGVRNSNTFTFSLTKKFTIKDGRNIDKNTLRLNMTVQTDNLIRVKVNGVTLSPVGGGYSSSGTCAEFNDFMSNGVDHDGYICPEFTSSNLSSLQLANGDAFSFGNNVNSLSVEIFSTYPNIGFFIDDISLSGEKNTPPPPGEENGCRPIPKYTIPKATDYGNVSNSSGGNYIESGPQIVEYGLYDNGVLKFVNSSLTTDRVEDITTAYTDGRKHNITIRELSDHVDSYSANYSPVVCPVAPETGECTGGEFTGWTINRSGPYNRSTAPAPASFICFDYKLKTKIELSGNKFEGGTDFGITMSVDNAPYTEGDSMWNDFYNEYHTHTKSKITQWQISMMKIAPGSAMPSYTKPGGFAINSDPCSYYGFGADCSSSKITGITSGSGGVTYQKGSISFSQSTIIPDVEAGTKYCLAFSVKPSTSENSNDSDTVNDSRWSHSSFNSSSNCFVVAKKPKVQVWGGDLVVGHKFSDNAKVNTDISNVKTNSVYKSNLNRTFGSWSEYGIFANGTIKAMASGAAFNNNAVAVVRSPNLCYLTYLSFIHNNSPDCNDNGYYKIGDYIKDFSSSFNAHGTTKLVGDVNLDTIGDGVFEAGNIDIKSSSEIYGKSIVIKSDGVVKINSNIKYKDMTYSNIDEIPQVVIIAKNIIIGDGVTNLDAWLIANNEGLTDGYIETCESGSTGSTNLTAFKCKEPLTINGAIASKRLYLERTYGAAPGVDSGKPAEILNLRADAYLWSYSQASKNGNIVTVYTYEAPVRF